MKVLVVFVLLFGVALSRPARSFSNSDSDSSEEVVRRPTSSLRRGTFIPQTRGALVQTFKASADSDESTEAADEDNQQQEAAAEDSTDGNSDTNAPSESDSEDSEDDDDDTEEEESEEEEEEEEEEEDDSSNSSESGESTTDSPATPTPIMVTEEPFGETTIEPIMPTIITDPDQGRGDSLGGYPSDYKSIVYAEDKSYNKIPSPYKSYEYVEEGKKSAYDMTHGNEVEKSMMVYKVQALQVHSDYLEEDTSTPEVDSQSLDNSVGAPEELNPRQASLPAEEEEEEATANSDSTNSDSGSSSTPEEEEDSASASQDDEDDESQSNEESEQSDESDESDSDEQGAGPDTSTDEPVVITAK